MIIIIFWHFISLYMLQKEITGMIDIKRLFHFLVSYSIVDGGPTDVSFSISTRSCGPMESFRESEAPPPDW